MTEKKLLEKQKQLAREVVKLEEDGDLFIASVDFWEKEVKHTMAQLDELEKAPIIHEELFKKTLEKLAMLLARGGREVKLSNALDKRRKKLKKKETRLNKIREALSNKLG
jgi:ribosome-binding ATPase YchF (GTP1/OBG family)